MINFEIEIGQGGTCVEENLVMRWQRIIEEEMDGHRRVKEGIDAKKRSWQQT